MSTGRPLQQQHSNVRVIKRQVSRTKLSPSKAVTDKQQHQHQQLHESQSEDHEDVKTSATTATSTTSMMPATPVKRPSPILKKVSSFDSVESFPSPARAESCNGELDFDSPLKKDGLIMEPPTPLFLSFTYGMYSDGSPNSEKARCNGMSHRSYLTDEELSSSCGSSTVEDPSPPPRITVAAVAEAKMKKKVTFAVPEAVTFVEKKRCTWITAKSDPGYIKYHDTEWGVPVHDDKMLFELLVLAGAQAELSWSAMLPKRDYYRNAFAGFDAELVSKFDEEKISSLAADPEILQHEGKIRQIVDNAKCIVEVVQEFGSLDKFMWNFFSHKPIVNRYRVPQQVPIKSAKSDYMSRELMKRGFRFVGPTIMYSFMQAAGMTNDHFVHCFRHEECIALSRTALSPGSSEQSEQQTSSSPS